MNTETKAVQHTPGPWYVQELERGTQIVYANDGATVICEGPDSMKYPTSYRAWIRANARLIAAAPEILRELEACVEAMLGTNCFHPSDQSIIDAQAAIQKAKRARRKGG
jgi:hypothetical protein